MQKRAFGKTGLDVSILGFGAGGIGDAALSEANAGRLLNSLLDAGICLIDTARSYGLSEERIGRHLKSRRSEYVLSTKIGYGIPGYQDWTAQIISAGVDHALNLLQTDSIDIVHLHSCPVETLMREEILRSLEDVVQSGKVRVAGYSGDNEAFEWALQCETFGSLQTSVNVCDQRALASLQIAQQKGIGVIAKRSLANAPWRSTQVSPEDNAAMEYQRRWKQLGFDFGPEEALRFVAYSPGVHCCLVGSANLHHILQNAEMINRGPLPPELNAVILETFRAHGSNWPGQI